MESPGKSRSIASQFRRNYAIVAIVPLVLLFVLAVIGTNMTRKRVEVLIGDVTSELNQDAKTALRDLGEQIVLLKARDVAQQLEIYFRMHSDKSIAEMRSDPMFMDLAIQPVGETGYTAVTEAGTYLFRVHPNSSLNDQDMRQFAAEMPSWWQIVQNAIDGTETTGYYDWTEPDGSTRQKFMATTPVGVPVDGVTIMVSATTYIDEFSAPVEDMNTRAATISSDYRDYVAQQSWTFSGVFAAVILLTAAGTYWFGSRMALRYIEPLQRLAAAARSFGEDYREVSGLSSITERDDEIGVLGSAFERMSNRMRELFTRLEHQVTQLGETQHALRENEEHVGALYERSRRQEEIYRSLIHSSADAIVMTDLDSRATYVSPRVHGDLRLDARRSRGTQNPLHPGIGREQDPCRDCRRDGARSCFHGIRDSSPDEVGRTHRRQYQRVAVRRP
ncbi:MAG: HAMP domain-containing protein [Gammaproteobacteria bacterium]|nr:HAMP domain-containing protein [Gammaproteobacteria bacterium]